MYDDNTSRQILRCEKCGIYRGRRVIRDNPKKSGIDKTSQQAQSDRDRR